MLGESRCIMPKSKRKYFQDPLFDQFRSDTCYVCCQKIAAAHQGVCVGQGLWRHLICKPGSRRWSASDVEGRLARRAVEKTEEGV